MCGPAAGSVAEARQEEFLMRVLIVGLLPFATVMFRLECGLGDFGMG